jgi:ATP-dependent helicase/nuclease subunit A
LTASAGSGKTYVLVERYLRLLESRPTWTLRDLAAVTFTEKAAREMRERLRARLEERAHYDAPRWQALSAQVESARISTIHALCAELLRAHAALLGLDPRFGILDENQALLMQLNSVEESLFHMANSAETAPLLHLYPLAKVRLTLRHLLKEGQLEDFIAAIPDDLAVLTEGWQTLSTDLSAALYFDFRKETAWFDGLTWFNNLNQQKLDFTKLRGDKLYEKWAKIGELESVFSAPQGQPQAFRSALLEMQEQCKRTTTSGVKSNWDDEELLNEGRRRLTDIKSLVESYLERLPPAYSEAEAENAVLLWRWRLAAQTLHATYLAAKRAQSVLDFNDLEQLADQLLQSHPNVSSGLQAILVDEYQDTNPTQHALIRHLPAPNEANRLFIVGDPKQSIYAFRGADVRQFKAAQAEILAGSGANLALTVSFRTHAPLVALFNRAFPPLFNTPRDKNFTAYEVDMSSEADLLKAQRSQAPSTDPCLIVADFTAKGELNGDEQRRWLAQGLAQQIRAWVVEGRPIYDKERGEIRPARYGDVAILLSAFTQVTLYEEALKAAGLPYVTFGGRDYYLRREVQDVLNALRAVYQPSDSLALASALRSPLFGLSEAGLYALTRGPQSLWEALASVSPPTPADQEAALLAYAVLHPLREQAGRVTAAEALESLLEGTAYDALLNALPDGDRRRANLDKLSALARSAGDLPLGDFLRQVEELSQADVREGEAVLSAEDAITLMTVHKSKGLEFPIVVLPDEGWGEKSKGGEKPAAWYDADAGPVITAPLKDEEEKDKPKTFSQWYAAYFTTLRESAEAKRLLYVAATRAQDLLYIALRESKSLLATFAAVIEAALQETPDLSAWVERRTEQAPSPDSLYARAESARTGWDWPLEASSATPPPLLQALDTQPRPDQVRHLSVSQLEGLAALETYRPDQQKAARRAFQHHLWRNALPPLRPVTEAPHDEAAFQRKLGLLVHRALQNGLEEQPPNKRCDLLAAYANKLNLPLSKYADLLAEAESLLRAYEAKRPPTLRQAGRILREVPFIYRFGGRILHGVIDVLYQVGAEWYILDYKTAPISAAFVPHHARRYLYQVGAYARALEARLGILPIVQVYYLHPQRLYTLPPSEWQGALDQIEAKLSAALRPL